MKTIRKILFLCGIILLTGFSCEKKENDFPYGICLKGKVVGFVQCYNYVLIQVADYKVGKKATVPILNDLGHVIDIIDYDNVIQSPSGWITNGLIYFVARKYNPDTDDRIVFCPANIAPYAVPTVVITKSSQIQCP